MLTNVAKSSGRLFFPLSDQYLVVEPIRGSVKLLIWCHGGNALHGNTI
jgi:hypothetical protein